MSKPKKTAPVRFKFYSDNDYNLDLHYSREFSDSDANAKIILYRINSVTTKTHNLYGESKAKNKKFLEPIELNVTLTVGDITNKFISKNSLNRESIDKLTFGVYKDELSEKNNITINRGDFLKYFDGEKERIFEITKVDNVTSNNSTLGFKPFFITVEATMSLDNVILV